MFGTPPTLKQALVLGAVISSIPFYWRCLCKYKKHRTYEARVHVGDPARLAAKRERLIAGGLDKLQVITDFDNTLTGKDSLSSWSILEDSGFFSAAYHARVKVLFERYYPYEKDLSLSLEERCRQMEQWWAKAGVALQAEHPTRGGLQRLVEQVAPRVNFRDRASDFLQLLHARQVPTLIMSAGLGDIIDLVLHNKGLGSLRHSSLHVVSNWVRFKGETDVVGQSTGDLSAPMVGWKGECIHVFNKDSGCIRSSPYFGDVKKRKNVILLGDSLGDLSMSRGLQSECVLTIGFINQDHLEHLDKYIAGFDIVLQGDNSFDYALNLVQAIMSNT